MKPRLGIAFRRPSLREQLSGFILVASIFCIPLVAWMIDAKATQSLALTSIGLSMGIVFSMYLENVSFRNWKLWVGAVIVIYVLYSLIGGWPTQPVA